MTTGRPSRLSVDERYPPGCVTNKISTQNASSRGHCWSTSVTATRSVSPSGQVGSKLIGMNPQAVHPKNGRPTGEAVPGDLLRLVDRKPLVGRGCRHLAQRAPHIVLKLPLSARALSHHERVGAFAACTELGEWMLWRRRRSRPYFSCWSRS